MYDWGKKNMTFNLIEIMEAVERGIEAGTSHIVGNAKTTTNDRIRLSIYDELIKLAKEKKNDDN